MIKIIDIKKKDKNYEVTFEIDKKKKTFLFQEELIIKFGIISNKQIDDLTYKEILKYNDRFTYYKKALNYISFKSRTVKEVEIYLKKHNCDDVSTKSIISEFISKNYLNDKIYTEMFVEYHSNVSKNGPKKIEHNLRKKGVSLTQIKEGLKIYTPDLKQKNVLFLIDKEIKNQKNKALQKAVLSIKQKLINKGYDLYLIDKCLEEKYDVLRVSFDETESLKKELNKVKSKLLKKNLNKFEFNEKVLSSLVLKGYSYENIKKIINE